MAGYTAMFSQTSGSFNITAGSLSLVPVTYQARIVKIEVTVDGAVGGATQTISRYISSTLSGGATVTPRAFRDGAAASSATAKSGATPSGTQQVLNLQRPIAGSGAYQFTSDVIVAPGNVLHVALATLNAAIVEIGIHYEVLYLARSN